MNPIVNKKSMADKEYRKRLYEENKDLYKKVRADFIYGISSGFRQKRKNSKKELVQFEEETCEAFKEMV